MMAAASFPELARALSEIGREAYARGWALGTSGNLSAVSGLDPLRLAITPSGVDKGRLAPEQILEIDGDARLVQGDGRPSDEAQVHLAVVARAKARERCCTPTRSGARCSPRPARPRAASRSRDTRC